MSGMTWALLAAGVFLVAYAVILISRQKQGKGGGKGLGVGFALVAALVWGMALGRLLEDFWTGMRLGAFAGLVLPAIGVLLQPERRGVVPALVLLILGVVMGAPVLSRLGDRILPSEAESKTARIEQVLNDLEERIEQGEAELKRLQKDREETVQALRSFGYDRFENVETDSAAFLRLKELMEIKRLQKALRGRLETFRKKRQQLSVALRRARRLADAESAAGDDLLEIDVESIVQEIKTTARRSQAKTVEEHMERDALRDLFDKAL